MMATATLHTPQQAAQWLAARVTGTLTADSRSVAAGDGFIAWPGAATDARQFVRAMLAQGATACLVEAEGAAAFGFGNDPGIAAYQHLKRDSGPIAAAWFGQPSRQLAVTAITGTNGKTSSAWWLAHALSKTQQSNLSPCGLIGTLGIGLLPRLESSGLTTPDPVRLQAALRVFADTGAQSCAMEASSVGLAEHRMDGTAIRVAAFTNLTQDHFDYHGSMDAYWQAKRALFDWPGLQAAVINADDPRGAELALQTLAHGLAVWTVGLNAPARLNARDLAWTAAGARFTLVEGQAQTAIAAPVVGDYNVGNLLLVAGCLRALGVPLADLPGLLADLPPVPGRMERVAVRGDDEPVAIVDYSHTPDALDKALTALRPLARARGGKLWCVFGCGGNRDPGKRPLMGAVVRAHADALIVTSDNPRDEDPQAIIDAILKGIADRVRVTVEPDRARAIAWAIETAQPADVILIAGKGHEDYQDVRGQRLPFSDQREARAALQRRTAAREACA
ncbi:MAG: UDP-N-acetylmuramoyl-L-alanyl-D-glutamate--2,6-diaminopimelate ligase [Burkholderiaceae bacterium]|jgi:UDP-N-acetylmuramoyl-L-alanyl-D-glutamate--2,6-diaminopimelate ligase|nr:UDP-N-acetylmuramoyl-L-alanyl-D-glutamate--2,6-diaminopimelate ligase [Burkholderiaceae bacterium]